jgi:septum formation protein
MTGLWRAADPLVLASSSRTRQALLDSAGIPFESRAAGVDERRIEAPLMARGANGDEIALSLARTKTLSIAAGMPGRLVLGADQTLSLGGAVLSKPLDRAGAIAQLEKLSGRVHDLNSGLCLARGEEILFESVRIARLTVRPLSATFIESYAALVGEAMMSSVGAYQVEGLGIHLFEAIEGDHSTILGLPLLPLLSYLRGAGFLVQ